MRFLDFSFWTVAQREVREGARRWANYRLRVGSGLAGMGLLWFTITNAPRGMAQTGWLLFQRLHCLILILILGIVPALAADCIAREKREGTLGFLFLTPLTANGVVIGKSFAQILRAFTLWLAIVPLLTIPFLSGGITQIQALEMITIEICAALLCMAAGITASTMSRNRLGAFCLAYLLAGIAAYFALLVFGELTIFRAKWFLRIPQNNGVSGFLNAGLFALIFGSYSPGNPLGPVRIFWLVFSVFVAVFVLRISVGFAAAVINAAWRDKPPSVQRLNLIRRFCTPLFNRRYHRRGQRARDRNPIAWLQQYSWKARASKWGLCGMFIVLESYALNSNSGGDFDIDSIQKILTAVLAGVITFFGVNGFLEEKRNGALELLLVTPIPVKRIILGRAWGLWRQFLPAALILLVGYLGARNIEQASYGFPNWRRRGGLMIDLDEGDFFTLFLAANAFIALPIIATYAALRVKNFFGAAFITWGALCAVLLFTICTTDTIMWKFFASDNSPVVFLCATLLVYNTAFVLLTFFMLRHSLSRRIYAF